MTRKSNTTLWSVVTLSILISQTTTAEDELGLDMLYSDERSVSIATGSSKPIHLAPSIASVITAEDIRDMGATTLDEALEGVPGLHVSRSFNRLNAIYSIRGIHTAENPQVLMLFNGLPITNLPTGSRPNTFRMPVAGIARIEVIRGPGSALYGADAFSGVINVISKSADEINGSQIGLRSGSFDSQEAWLLQSANWGDWQLAFNLEWQKSAGDEDRRVGTDQQSQLDSLLGTNASLAPGALDTHYDTINAHLQLAREHWNIGFWNWQQRDAGLGPGSAQALDPQGNTKLDGYLLDLDYRNADAITDWELRTRASLYFKDEENFFHVLPAGTLLPIGADGNINPLAPAGLVFFSDGVIGTPGGTELTKALELTGLYTGLQAHRLQIGFGYKTQKINSEESKNFGPGVIDGSIPLIDGTLTDVTDTPFIFLNDKRRTIHYLTLQDEWAFAPDWELTAGLRYDHYSDFGDTVNPRLALVWASSQNLTTKLLYGRAFRAPSFSELYFINNPALLGNPSLDAETIQTLELSFDYRPRYDIHTVFSLFTYESRDLINPVQDPLTLVSMAQNINKQRGHGFEYEARWSLRSDLQLYGNFAWQDAEDANTGEPVPDAPGRQLYLGVLWKPVSDWSVSSQLNWIADRERSRNDLRAPLDDDTLVNLTLRRENIARHWEIAASINNLFDHDAYAPSNGLIADDYPLQGRSVYAELRYSR